MKQLAEGKYDEAKLTALYKAEDNFAAIIEGYRTRLVAEGTIADEKYDIKGYTKFKGKAGVDKILNGINQALQLVPA